MVEQIDVPENNLKWSSVSLSEVMEHNNRFEASVFKIEAKQARELLSRSMYPLKKLYGNNSFFEYANNSCRFKRDYRVKSSDSIGFIGSSEILDVYPRATKYISKQQAISKKLVARLNEILISCSGTIGNVSLVSKTLSNNALSQHMIRAFANDYYGYIYAFLKTKIGETLIKTDTYGSVVQHIEPDHLKNISIPNPPEEIKKKIHNLVVKSYALRDESNDLIDEAERLLVDELKLPPLEDFKPKYFDTKNDIRNYEVSLSNLNHRFDGSYHIPLVDCIKEHLSRYTLDLFYLNKEIKTEIILPGRFSRTYVDESQGVKFLGGKDLFQLNPSTEKYLSKHVHEKIIQAQLGIKENDLIMPSRGTIGRFLLAPKHFEGWAISDNLMRILIEDKNIVGYIYCFFNSEYGRVLIQREIYGGVVNAIEPNHLYEIPIPILKNKEIQTKINNLVLEANQKRYEAYMLEQQAIKTVNEKVIYA